MQRNKILPKTNEETLRKGIKRKMFCDKEVEHQKQKENVKRKCLEAVYKSKVTDLSFKIPRLGADKNTMASEKLDISKAFGATQSKSKTQHKKMKQSDIKVSQLPSDKDNASLFIDKHDDSS